MSATPPVRVRAAVVEFRERVVEVREGEFIVVPQGVEHQPVAKNGVRVLVFEPASTLNTGDLVTDRTVAPPERI